MPVPGPGASPFDPADGPPDPARGQPVGQLMTGSPGAMQPPATPEEHAANKAGWMQLFSDPRVTAALGQFTANILQPRYHQSVAGMIGGAFGAAGEAAGRVTSQQQEATKQAADVEEAKARTSVFKTEADIAPQKLQLQIDKLQSMTDIQNARLENQRMLDQAIAERDQAQIQTLSAQSAAIDARAAALDLSGARAAYDAWTKAILPGQPPPDPMPFGLTPEKARKLGLDPSKMGYSASELAPPSGAAPGAVAPTGPLPTIDQIESNPSIFANKTPDQIAAARTAMEPKGVSDTALQAWRIRFDNAVKRAHELQGTPSGKPPIVPQAATAPSPLSSFRRPGAPQQ